MQARKIQTYVGRFIKHWPWPVPLGQQKRNAVLPLSSSSRSLVYLLHQCRWAIKPTSPAQNCISYRDNCVIDLSSYIPVPLHCQCPNEHLALQRLYLRNPSSNVLDCISRTIITTVLRLHDFTNSKLWGEQRYIFYQ
jgi:hypothetical protein